MYVSGHHCVEGREVTCNLYACDKPCNISPNRTPLVYIHFWGLGRKSSPSMHFNNPKNFCRQSVTNHKSNNIVIAANPNLYNSMHFVKCVSLLDILNTKSLKESKCNFIHFPTNQCFLELRFLFSLWVNHHNEHTNVFDYRVYRYNYRSSDNVSNIELKSRGTDETR